MKTYSFENLDVWKKSRELVVCVYNIQSCFHHLKNMVWETN